MAQTVAKLFKKADEAEKAVADLKGMGCEATVLSKGTDVEKELAGAGFSKQALDYYKMGLAIGGKVVKASADESKLGEVNQVLLATGHDRLVHRPAQWATSPGFASAVKMSATNPIDAKMTGDFRVY